MKAHQIGPVTESIVSIQFRRVAIGEFSQRKVVPRAHPGSEGQQRRLAPLIALSDDGLAQCAIARVGVVVSKHGLLIKA